MTTSISNIGTCVAGVKFENPLLNAAGCCDINKDQLDELMASRAGGVVTKSGTLLARGGNIYPRLFIDNSNNSINSIGFDNMGVQFYAKYRSNVSKPFIQSIHADNPSELPGLLNSLTKQSPRLIELDIGCPNVPKEKQGLNWDNYETLLSAMSMTEKELIWGVKLPPLFYPQDISQMARLVQKSNASFITTINTIPNGLLVDIWHGTTRIHPNEGRGGIGGATTKPIGLANVQQFYKEFGVGRQIDIIGCGGISSATDIMEYIMCGAKAVQIGTYLLKYGPDIFKTLEQQLSAIVSQLARNRSMVLSDFVGTLKVQKAAL